MSMRKAGKASTIKHPKFAPLTLDSTFKKAFANEQCTELLVFLLNAFLGKVLKKPIVDVNIVQPVQQAKTRHGRGAVFDIHCEDAAGSRFIVEMQVEEQACFIKRTFFYLCLAVINLAKKGKKESKGKKIPYDFNIPVVYTLSFLNFDLDFGKGCDEVIQYLSLSNDLHPKVRYDVMHMVYVRLTRFNKTEAECETIQDKILFSLKNMHELKSCPKNFRERELRDMFEIARITNFTKEEIMDYEREMMAYSDRYHAMEFAKEKAEASGMARGLERGKKEIARNMLGDGVEPAVVARYTKLPLKAVKALR